MSQVGRESDEAARACCADFYSQAAVKYFLGESFHPGGLELTLKLAEKLGIQAGTHVLDVACGEGTSAFFLANTFGCRVVGADASEKGLQVARERLSSCGKACENVTFVLTPSDHLPIPDETFDFAITECSFSTFWNKKQSAAEIHRVLKPGGYWGLSDMVVKQAELPPPMKTLLFQAGCLGEAETLEGYAEQMRRAGFHVLGMEEATWALDAMLHQIEKRLLAAKLLSSLSRLPVTKDDLSTVADLLEQGKELLGKKIIGYGILIGKKFER